MHELLQALPADAYELRDKVTKYFERVTTLNLMSHFDSSLFETYRTNRGNVKEHSERLAEEGLVGSAKRFVDHSWKVDLGPWGKNIETLWSQLTVVKPAGLRG